MVNKLYNELAYYYHLTDGDKSDDLDFYLQLAKECSGTILDYGCGSGRIAIALAKAGFNVIATDISTSLLSIFKSNLNNEPSSVRENIRIVSIEDVWSISSISLCILAYNTFNEITDSNEQEKLFDNLFNVLKPNGMIGMEILPLFDYWPYLKLERVLKLDSNLGTLLSYIQFQPESDINLFRTVCIFEHLSTNGELISKLVGETIRRQISLSEVTRLLKWSRFTIQNIFSCYPNTNQSNKTLIIAQKSED